MTPLVLPLLPVERDWKWRWKGAVQVTRGCSAVCTENTFRIL